MGKPGQHNRQRARHHQLSARRRKCNRSFISTVQHELRTPIAIIKGYASTLGREDVEWDSETVRENVAIIEDEADRLDKSWSKTC